ncbi:MAG: hypothetical protein H7263_17980 [Candidatus Sericytochromatia bacterium]|nr:hypothetical protein [Candidatus Sericytochromatia bacterium]
MAESEDERFFRLLVNISLSSESSLERLSTSLKIFVQKYFENSDFSAPTDSLEIVMDSVMKSEAILYTVYELEVEAITNEAKLELLYYKDLVMKSLVILTNLDFFVLALKEAGLFKDAYNLREKVKLEFRIEAASLKQNIESGNFLQQGDNQSRLFKDIRPTEYRKIKKINYPTSYTTAAVDDSTFIANNALEDTNTSSSDENNSNIDISETIHNEKSKFSKYDPYQDFSFELDDENEDEQTDNNKFISPLEALKIKARENSKEIIQKTDKNGNKILRTATGWELPIDFFDNGIYS